MSSTLSVKNVLHGEGEGGEETRMCVCVPTGKDFRGEEEGEGALIV